MSILFLYRALLIFLLRFSVTNAYSVVCHRDKEGAWAIGMVAGPNPFQMKPLMRTVTIGDSEQVCHVNPALTCADASIDNATFLADPFMFFPNGTDGAWYVFFELKLLDKHGAIGVSKSVDRAS